MFIRWLGYMKNIKKLILLFAVCCISLSAGTNTVQACPMCKIAAEDAGNDRLPQAYMASILAMLSMPTLIFTVLGVSLYRISDKEQQIADQLNNKTEK